MSDLQAPLPELVGRDWGAHFEADIAAVLITRGDVVRAFEFAIVDYVLDCSRNPAAMDVSYADRLWGLQQEVSEHPDLPSRIMVPFDVKSRISHLAHEQVYLTSVGQREQVAFFIGVCAANPDYVDLIPNYLGGRSLECDRPSRGVAVNSSRKPLVGPSAYGFLSPCNSAFRMPLDLLPKAFDSIRACALDRVTDYVNPWTRARFRNWRPITVRSDECLMPEEVNQGGHFTAYEGTSRIRWAIRNASVIRNVPLAFDLLFHQPYLADFKLIVTNPKSPSSGAWLVQYKIDSHQRANKASLTKVAVGRSGNRGLRYYFTALERFDYLLYEFQLSTQGIAETFCFFLPEKILPDRFYRTKAIIDSFGDAEFKPYWILMDAEGKWVEKMYAIIEQNPTPRRSGQRPRRPWTVVRDEAQLDRDHIEGIPDDTRPDSEPTELDWFHETFFRTIMHQCACRQSGVLVVLARGHPMGDFAYCRYRWTELERDTYLSRLRPPCTVSSLAAHVPLLTISLFARRRVGTLRGPSLSAVEVRRLASESCRRILCFDLFGEMGRESCCPLAIVPSDDISHTQDQRAIYEKALGVNHHDAFGPRVPLVSEQLHSGYTIADYTIAGIGPMILGDAGNRERWSEIWRLLDSFSGTTDFSFPEGRVRDPHAYQVTVREMHQRYVDDVAQRHVHSPTAPQHHEQQSTSPLHGSA